MTEKPLNENSESESNSQSAREPLTPRKPIWSAGHRVSALAAAVVLLLALGAVLWPGSSANGYRGVCLVFDPGGGSARDASLYRPLAKFFSEAADQPMELVVARTVADFQVRARAGADLVICPDGLGVALDSEHYVPLVAGRRTAPRNLRPRCVLVYRQSAGLVDRPWKSAPDRTVFGDSLSLCATGVLRTASNEPGIWPPRCASGPDPYDHSPVLHALRLGGFDYALVRQWDAERFFAESLLPGDVWGMEIMTGPVPDLVVFASREIPAAALLDLGSELTELGRAAGGDGMHNPSLIRSLSEMHLSGFNLLVEPDLDLVRGSFPRSWPPAGQ